MRCYSPEPHSKYCITTGDFTYRLVDEGRPAAWNLVWLSVPQVDDLLDPNLDRNKFYDTLPSAAIGGLSAASCAISESLTFTVESIMGQSAVAFVTDYLEMFDFQSTSGWKLLGGQAWLDTMMRRAYLSDGMSEAYAAAKSSDKILLVDFSLRRKSNTRIESQEIEEQIHIEEQQPISGLIILNGGKNQSSDHSLVTGNAKFSNARSIKDQFVESTTNQAIEAIEDKKIVIADLPNGYVDNRNGTITDPRSGLTWMRCLLGQRFEALGCNKCTGTANTYTWENAKLIRHQYAGHDDWRLPTIDELESIFGKHSDRNQNKAIFPWLANEDDIFSTTCVWSSSTATAMDIFTVYAYHPNDDSIADCFDNYLDDHHQILLMRSIAGGSNAVMGANIEQQNITQGLSSPDEIIGSAIDDASISATVVVLLNMVERFEARFEAMESRIELLTNLLAFPQSKFAVDAPPHTKAGRIDVGIPVDATYLEFLYWLVEQQSIAYSDLRTRLLPLDLLPGAVINDINERALDLTGEPALEEDGDTMIVRQEVLLQVIDTWDVP